MSTKYERGDRVILSNNISCKGVVEGTVYATIVGFGTLENMLNTDSPDNTTLVLDVDVPTIYSHNCNGRAKSGHGLLREKSSVIRTGDKVETNSCETCANSRQHNATNTWCTVKCEDGSGWILADAYRLQPAPAPASEPKIKYTYEQPQNPPIKTARMQMKGSTLEFVVNRTAQTVKVGCTTFTFDEFKTAINIGTKILIQMHE